MYVCMHVCLSVHIYLSAYTYKYIYIHFLQVVLLSLHQRQEVWIHEPSAHHIGSFRRRRRDFLV